MEKTRRGDIPPPVRAVAHDEHVSPQALRDCVAAGKAVIMVRGDRAVGIGQGLLTKINVNLGTSTMKISIGDELQKARLAEEFGADTISDLSMGGDIDEIRRAIFDCTTTPITTVPIYQAAAMIGLRDMTADDIIGTLRKQVEQGVSSCVIHCVNHAMLDSLRKHRRVLGVVSKGGSITAAFMIKNKCENPFIERFDEVVSICRKYDVVLSLGNTARSGCIHDRRDWAQREELRQNTDLAERAHEKGVSVIIEGAGGHVRADRIAPYIRYYKRRSRFPLFVAGPLPTDIALGYDHIAGCTGAAMASSAGADYLCYLTPAEHLGLPGPDAVREGLIAFRIAAHIGDIVKYGRDNKDREIAGMRAALDREGQIRCALDPDRAKALSDGSPECTMCGEFCAIRMMKEL